MPLFSLSGERPNDLGVNDGRLKPCPDTPNCVCSQDAPSDKEHYIEPIAYSGEGKAAVAQLKAIIEGMERSQVIETTDNYLYAEFTSKIMGFVDDIEFYVDSSASVIHARAAARLGKSDLGVNRKRIEEIHTAFEKT
ncbi:MAG: DUF1499 domain-containing protein [Cyanobacteria bacterium J06633_23]